MLTLTFPLLRRLMSCGLLGMFVLLSGSCKQKDDQVEIRKCFALYQKALQQKKGKMLGFLLDQKTLKHYDQVAYAVRGANKEQINALPIYDRLTALSVRHALNNKIPVDFNGHQLLAACVENDLMGDISAVKIKTIDLIEKNTAKARIMDKKGAEINIYFYNEDDGWKLNLTKIIDSGKLSAYLAAEGKPEEEFIFDALEKQTGQRPDSTIYTPPLLE